MPQAIDLNIYLAKPRAATPEQVLRDPAKLEQVQLSADGLAECHLWIKRANASPPTWAEFFLPDVQPGRFGRNSSTGAVLFARYKDKVFLLAFGSGHHLFDKANIEMNFGLKTALSLIDESSLRSIDKSTFEQKPSQTRQQTGTASELQYFGIDVERDLLRAVTGKPKEANFGKRISGMDALKLNLEIELSDLPDLFANLLEAYESGRYKEGAFSWVDHIGEVKDRAVHRELDDSLIRRIGAGDYERAWLTVPEIIDWNQVVWFKYSDAASATKYYDVRLPDLISNLRGGKVSIQKLKQRSIFAIDDDDRVVFHGQAYRFLYAEADHDGSVYVLNNGKWYKVEQSYAEQINRYFENVPRYDKALPEYNDPTEGEYNERVVSTDPENLVLLDKKNIKVSAAASSVEPCDLFRDGFEFIHVKRYGGSSVLSHLFNQGLVSGQLFQMEEEFREMLNEKLPGRFKLRDYSKRPATNDYRVVFAIVSESDEDDLTIPFFSKISLKHVVMHLQAIGFDVFVTKIAVNEIKKKIKQIPSRR